MSYVTALEKYKEQKKITKFYGFFNDFSQEDQAKEALLFLLMLDAGLLETEVFYDSCLGDSKIEHPKNRLP